MSPRSGPDPNEQKNESRTEESTEEVRRTNGTVPTPKAAEGRAWMATSVQLMGLGYHWLESSVQTIVTLSRAMYVANNPLDQQCSATKQGEDELEERNENAAKHPIHQGRPQTDVTSMTESPVCPMGPGSPHPPSSTEEAVTAKGGFDVNWKALAGAAVVGGGVAVVAAPFAISAAGFGTTGVAAGSFAAAWQSGIGNVVVGSTFAGLQSAGAAGLGAAGTAAAAAAGAVAGAGTGAAVEGARRGYHYLRNTAAAAAGTGAAVEGARRGYNYLRNKL